MNSLLEFLKTEGLFVTGVASASFIYLLVDLFIVVKTFGSILKTRSFWMFWFCIFILNLLAFEALKGSQDPTRKPFGDAQPLALIVFSTLGTVAILQSFALKIGDRKVVDVGKIVDDFRATVLEDISRSAAAWDREFTFRTATELHETFKDNPEELRNEFASVMSFGGRAADQVSEDLARIEEEARALRVPVSMLLAQRIAKADVREAQRLLTKVKFGRPTTTASRD